MRRAEPQPRRVAAYLRVSTDEQRRAETIEQQRIEISRLIEFEGYEQVRWYLDDGQSGKLPLELRPGARDLLRDARAGRFDLVLLRSIDRLGRSLKVILDGYNTFQALGIEIVSMKEKLDTTTPAGRLVFHVFSSLAEWEADNITERMLNGRQRVIDEGRWPGGLVPYGYIIDRDGFPTPWWQETDLSHVIITDEQGQPIDPDSLTPEAPVIEELFLRVAAGESQRSIYNDFTRRGTPSTIKAQRDNRLIITAATWMGRNTSRRLSRPYYYGAYTWGTNEYQNFPAIISQRLFEQAQEQRRAPGRRHDDADPAPGLMSALMTCGTCGGRFYQRTTVTPHRSNGKRYRFHYYSCSSQKTANSCHAKLIPVDELDTWAWNRLLLWFERRRDLVTAFIQSMRQLDQERGQAEAEEEQLATELTRLGAEKQVVLTLYREQTVLQQQGQPTLLEPQDLLAQMGDIARQQETLKRRRAELQRRGLAIENEQELEREIVLALQKIREEINGGLSQARKREIMRQFVKSAVVETIGEGRQKDYELHITWRFSLEPGLDTLKSQPPRRLPFYGLTLLQPDFRAGTRQPEEPLVLTPVYEQATKLPVSRST